MGEEKLEALIHAAKSGHFTPAVDGSRNAEELFRDVSQVGSKIDGKMLITSTFDNSILLTRTRYPMSGTLTTF